MHSVSLLIPASLLIGSAAFAQAYSESFEGGSNPSGWSFGAPNEGPTTPGGVIGTWHYRATGLDTTIPFLRCAANATGPTGNFRARRVGMISTCLRVDATDFPVSGLPPAVILISLNGTPADPSDDWGAYALSGRGLGPTGEWRRHLIWLDPTVATPSPGWQFIQFGPNAPANPSWSALVTQVDRLEFSFGDPSLFYIFQMWTVSADAIWLSPGLCYPNCDGSTVTPFLNVNDFVCFVNLFATGDPRANCDGSTVVPALNVNDFNCFNGTFASGCSAP
ncbi:MAG: hypothetical protein ACKVW3_00990 [Phycisphaerales bacterium]